MKKAIYILTILVFGTTFAQENKDSDCDLQSKNKLWKSEFEKTNSETKRIELIKKKIRLDSIYAYPEPKIITAHGPLNKQVDDNGNDCGCKILFFLIHSNRKAVELNLNSNPELSEVVEKLDSENVELILYSFDENAVGNEKCGLVKLRMKTD